MTEWPWDPTLFEGSAPYYDKGRVPYSPALAEVMAGALALDGSGRLLDVGCGPGTIALRLAHLFESVVGLDADPGMLAEAGRLAAERGVTNATWVHRRAEELPAGLGTFRVVTFAQSFHWMDRDRVAAAVRTMLEPGGAVVHVDHGGQEGYAHDASMPFPPPPDDAMVKAREPYLGPHRRAGQSLCSGTPGEEELVWRPAGFAGPERVPVPDGRVLTRTIDQLVASTFSSSSAAPHLFGDRMADFEADLRQLLAEASPSGDFSMRATDNELLIWRPVGSRAPARGQ